VGFSEVADNEAFIGGQTLMGAYFFS